MKRHDYDITVFFTKRGVTIMVSEPGFETVGSKDLTCEDWIFDVMGCEDAFKTRLAVYKFEGNALAWWKAYKQAKGGDAWLITVTWAEFMKLFFLQFFSRAEQERLKREYHSIRQTNTETSTEFMQCFL
uniref:Zinc finger, CCHC-type, retrotransposon Gag domain protein n=1 Tax=Tanacetum cinerariifolium TaxID=118510 RepID=A0A699TU67_TANCI|nr:zinc finger, CCHC-type, retrotransposon Gag domain protein [Tanacetum cinerariifolium]